MQWDYAIGLELTYTYLNITQIYTVLPTTVSDPVKRMKVIHQRMDALKNSPAPYINHYFGKFFYSIPFFTV